MYEQEPYDERGERDTRNSRDDIYAEGGSQLLLDVSETSEGDAATFNVALYTD